MRTNLKTLLFLTLFISPSLVLAHPAGVTVSGWYDGFYHPLHGWDHLLTMLAVGIWAAQMRGRAVWQLPIAFVGMMSLGGLVGVTGVSIPGVELMILLSVAVFIVLVTGRIRFRATISVLIVVFFGFFHGFAHGQEMPASVSLLSFALGFMLATLLLHGAGILTVRLLVLTMVFFSTAAHTRSSLRILSQSNPSQLPRIRNHLNFRICWLPNGQIHRSALPKARRKAM